MAEFDTGAGNGFVAKLRDIICDGRRGCMCEKRAPVPGPCQAFAEKPSGPRIVDGGQTGVYLVRTVKRHSIDALDMALGGAVVVLWVDDSCSLFGSDELVYWQKLTVRNNKR